MNLVRFCEVVVSKCRNLKFINVVTVAIPANQHNDQKVAFQALSNDLKKRNITMQFEFSEQLHDRQVMWVSLPHHMIASSRPFTKSFQSLRFPLGRLSNGYIIKIGRGLNYFLPAEKFCLGTTNYDFRRCKETNVDIFFCPENKTTWEIILF